MKRNLGLLGLLSLTLGLAAAGSARAELPTGITTLFFDLSCFQNQHSASLSATSGYLSGLTYQAFDGTQMRTYNAAAGFQRTQMGTAGQSAYNAARNDWFYTMCVEPTAYLNVPNVTQQRSTKDFQQIGRLTDPLSGDLLASLYQDFAARKDPGSMVSQLYAGNVGMRVGLQIAMWEIAQDFRSDAPGYGLSLSEGNFNFLGCYASGQTNRAELIAWANTYLDYARVRASRGDLSGYEAQLFYTANTTDANGVRRGQDLIGGRSVPEPGALALALLALPGALLLRRRRV